MRVSHIVTNHSKACTRCRSVLPLSEFHRNSHSPNGYAYYCKGCTQIGSRRYYEENRDAVRARSHARNLRKYGLSPEEKIELLDRQGGVCAICGGIEQYIGQAGQNVDNLGVDHDHKTDAVRGILCFTCNTGIGNFQDQPDLLEIAAEYLRASS